MSRVRLADLGDDFDDLFGDDADVVTHRRPRRRSPSHDETVVVAHPPAWDVSDDDPDLPAGTRRSTYQESRAAQGPQPPPTWLITSSGALDRELGVVKTGKEADVDLVERVDPATGARCLLAAKRYRASTHRLFHRDAGYLEGRRVRKSRETRAMATRTRFGRDLIAAQWALAEFDALGWLWCEGVAVPYPVQLNDTELLIEFIGDGEGVAAPRLADVRPTDVDLGDLWQQCRWAVGALASFGFAHGDLSAYNLLVDDGRLVLIDLPQIVDVVGNVRGGEFLRRDCTNAARWFAARGVDVGDVDGWVDDLMADAAKG